MEKYQRVWFCGYSVSPFVHHDILDSLSYDEHPLQYLMEVLYNSYSPLAIDSWNSTLRKSIDFAPTWACKKIRTAKKGMYEDLLLGNRDLWEKGECPNPKEIMTLKLFTDWTDLQFELKKCFRLEQLPIDEIKKQLRWCGKRGRTNSGSPQILDVSKVSDQWSLTVADRTIKSAALNQFSKTEFSIGTPTHSAFDWNSKSPDKKPESIQTQPTDLFLSHSAPSFDDTYDVRLQQELGEIENLYRSYITGEEDC